MKIKLFIKLLVLTSCSKPGECPQIIFDSSDKTSSVNGSYYTGRCMTYIDGRKRSIQQYLNFKVCSIRFTKNTRVCPNTHCSDFAKSKGLQWVFSGPTLCNKFVDYSSSVEFPVFLRRGTTIHKIPTTFV